MVSEYNSLARSAGQWDTPNRRGSYPPTDMPASFPVLFRQWREWCTIACTTWPIQEDGFAAKKLASASYTPTRIKLSESRKPSVTASRPPSHNAAWWLSLNSRKPSIMFKEKNSCLQQHLRASRSPSPDGCVTFYQAAWPRSI